MSGGIGLRHLLVARFGLDAFGHHRIVRHEEERTGRYMIIKAAGEERSRLHIHAHRPRRPQIVLETLVMFPKASVCRVDRAGPIVVLIVTQGGRDGTLQHKSRQGGNFRREIVPARPLAADTGQRENIVAKRCFLRDAATFP